MWKMKKIVRAIFEISKKHIIFLHLLPYNPGLWFLSEKPPCEFWDLMGYLPSCKKIKRILRAVLEKNCGLTKLLTNYGSDLIGPFPTKGQGSKSQHTWKHNNLWTTHLVTFQEVFRRKRWYLKIISKILISVEPHLLLFEQIKVRDRSSL